MSTHPVRHISTPNRLLREEKEWLNLAGATQITLGSVLISLELFVEVGNRLAYSILRKGFGHYYSEVIGDR